MTRETRLKLAKHYLSLSKEAQEFQKELAKYVPEYMESLKSEDLKPAAKSKGKK